MRLTFRLRLVTNLMPYRYTLKSFHFLLVPWGRAVVT